MNGDEAQRAILVQLRNRKAPDYKTNQLQIDSNISPALLSDYLNGLLETKTEYIFYFENERILGSLTEIIEKFKIGFEEAITIDYVDVKDLNPDTIIDCGKIIIDLVLFENKVYANSLHGEVLVIENMKPKPISNSIKFKIIAADQGIYGAFDRCIYDVLTGEELYSFESEIIFLKTANLYIAVGTKDKRIYIYQTEVKSIIDTVTIENPFRGLYITPEHLYWLESVDTVVEYDIKTKDVLYFSTQQSVVDFVTQNKAIYCSTSDRMVVCAEGHRLNKKEVGLQMAEKIFLNGNNLILASQYEVIVLNKEDMKEVGFLKFDEQINAVLVQDGILYISQGKSVLSYGLASVISSDK